MNLWQKTVAAVRRALTAQEFVTGADLGGGGRGRMANPYAQSVWVQAAIAAVAGPIKSVPVKFYLGEEEWRDAGAEAFWAKPAQGMTREEFIEATCGWYKLAGEFFWLLDDSWLSRGAAKSRLIVARPDEMREVLAGGEVVGWEWRDGAARRHALIPEQVVHVKRWNPYNRHRGLGELESAAMAAETDWMAGRFARDSYANAGEQGDFVVAKGAAPTAEQQAQIVEALRAKRRAKLRGDFRPVFLAGDLDVKPATVAGPDAAMSANRLQSRHEVFVAFGVPASMADVQASYSIGSASDYFRLIHGTCMPLASLVASAMSGMLLRQAGVAAEAFFDFDEHPVMQAVRNERIDAALKLWGAGMPMEKVNAYLDLGLEEFAGWERGWLPFSLQPAGEELQKGSDGADTAATTGEEEADPVAAMVRALSGKAEMLKAEKLKNAVERDDTGETPVLPGCTCTNGGAKSASWLAHWRSRQGTIKIYRSKFERMMMRARAEVLGKLQKQKGVRRAQPSRGNAETLKRSAAEEINFDLEEWSDELVMEMNKAGRSALDTAGRQAKAEIGKADDAWTMPPAKAVEFLRGRENFMRDIADAVHQAIEEQLVEGITAGDTMAELAERVRGTFNGMTKARAMTIASTETAAAYGSARQEALEQSGVQWKQWLTSGNDNVRPTHAAAEGQTRRIAEPFTVGGASLMFPGDGSLGAGPEETINCHCVSVAVEGPGEKRKAESGDRKGRNAEGEA